jgi:outer membrane protein assembly factor BamD
MKRGYYTKALEQFNRIRNYNRDDPVALKAELAIADLYFKKGEWAQARMAYEEFQRMHPRNADLDYVVYRIGLTLWKEAPAVAARDQSSTRQAVDVWSGFQARFPSSPHAEDCGKALEKGRNRIARKEFIIGQFYYRRGAWKAVIGRIEPMLAQHPQATVRPDALEILAEAHLQLGDTTRAMEALASLRAIEGQAERARRLERRLDAIRRHHKAS